MAEGPSWLPLAKDAAVPCSEEGEATSKDSGDSGEGEPVSMTKGQHIANAKQRHKTKGIQLRGDNFQFVSSEVENFMAKALFPKPKSTRGRGCRVSDRDEAAKQRLGYTNPRSYVRLDGSEVLYGKDWTQRKKELWARCGGKCERIVDVKHTASGPGYYVRCKSEAHDAHHIVKRSKKRNDQLEALEALCRLHHELVDERKVRWGPGLSS